MGNTRPPPTLHNFLNGLSLTSTFNDYPLELKKGMFLPGEVLRLVFAGYVSLASQSPYPIIVYSVANFRPHLSQF